MFDLVIVDCRFIDQLIAQITALWHFQINRHPTIEDRQPIYSHSMVDGGFELMS
jgi:hypothetical protein